MGDAESSAGGRVIETTDAVSANLRITGGQPGRHDRRRDHLETLGPAVHRQRDLGAALFVGHAQTIPQCRFLQAPGRTRIELNTSGGPFAIGKRLPQGIGENSGMNGGRRQQGQQQEREKTGHGRSGRFFEPIVADGE